MPESQIPQSKARALEIVAELESSELEHELETAQPDTSFAKRAVTKVLDALSDADADAAALRVAKLRLKHPEENADELSERIIKAKAQQTAAVGAASSGASMIPVVGMLSAMTLGVAADITATFKLQAEMVLEIAAAYDFKLDELDEQTVIFIVTGVSTGSNVVLNRVGEQLSVKLGERTAEKWLAAALPFVGVALSSSSNALATYVIGQRARAYFRDGPEAVGDFKSSLSALAGLDELKVGSWLAETSGKTWDALTDGVSAASGAVVDAAQFAGGAVATGSSKTAATLVDAGQNVGERLSDAATGIGKAARGLFDKRGKKSDADKSEPENNL